MKPPLRAFAIISLLLVTRLVGSEPVQDDQGDKCIDARVLLEKTQKTALPEGLIIRIGACMGETDANVPATAKELVELWEFTTDEVHRVKCHFKDGKPIYSRLESRDFDSKGLCKDLLDGQALEIQARKGTGPDTVLAGTMYQRGSRSIEVEFNGETILDLHETNGPVLDVYRKTDAEAFGRLYDRLAVKAHEQLGPKVGVTSKLEWQKSGVANKLDKYQPWTIELDEAVPKGLKSVPKGLASPRYGVFKVGPPEIASSIFIIVDAPAGQPATLYVDRKGTGLLADEQGHPLVAQNVKRPNGSNRTMHVAEVMIEIPFAEDTREANIIFRRYDPKTDPDVYELSMQRTADFGYTGATNINGKLVSTVVWDMGCTGETKMNGGWKSVPNTWFDLNGDGKPQPEEIMWGDQPFKFDGKWWAVATLGNDGLIRIVPSREPVPEPPKADLSQGKPAPSFTSTTVDGKTVKFPADFKGKVVLLDFWATWCGPCRAEIPHVVKAYSTYHDKGLEIIGISEDDEDAKEELLKFMTDNAMPWPQIISDKKGEEVALSNRFGFDSLPFTLLVDGDTGIIIASGLRGEAIAPTIGKALESKTKK